MLMMVQLMASGVATKLCKLENFSEASPNFAKFRLFPAEIPKNFVRKKLAKFVKLKNQWTFMKILMKTLKTRVLIFLNKKLLLKVLSNEN